MANSQHTATVFAPTLYLTITVERSSTDHDDEVHIHPGGQGFWIARVLKHLGERPLLSGPIGGESGQVFLSLLAQWGMDVSPIKTAGHTGVIVQDRRSGDRVMLAQSAGMRLQRHDIDDAYGRLLEHALTSSMCVVTGQSSEIVPTDVYRRLGHDLRSGGVTVVADLHGPELWAFLEGGPIDLLKVSDEDLAGDDLLTRADADFGECRRVMDRLVDAGVRSIVLSRQHRPALARFGSQLFEAQVPKFDPADHRGAGDSMTAGLTAATIQGKSIVETLRLGCAAGAANVTRHGLGNANGDLIASLVERVVVKELSPSSL